MDSLLVLAHKQKRHERLETENLRCLPAIQREIAQYDDMSPIIRGPVELSYAICRIFQDETYLAMLSGSRTDQMTMRKELIDFIAFGLELHASDRGKRYVADDPSLDDLASQFELWAAELAGEKIEFRSALAKVQFALSQELVANLRSPSRR